MTDLSPEAKKAIADWFGGFDTGLSSQTIAITALTGFPPSRASHPHDPADFGRCVRLIERVPEVRLAAFDVLVNQGQVWPKLIAEWDNLTAIMSDEAGLNYEKQRRAPATYGAIRRIIDAGKSGQ